MKKVTLQCSSVTISITFIAMKLFKLLYCNCFQMFGLKRRERVPSFRPSSLQVQCHSQGGQHQRCPHGGETPQQQENATHGKDGALHITSASSRTQELKSLHIRAQVNRGICCTGQSLILYFCSCSHSCPYRWSLKIACTEILSKH